FFIHRLLGCLNLLTQGSCMEWIFRSRVCVLALLLGALSTTPSLEAKTINRSHKSSSSESCDVCKKLGRIGCKQKKCCHEIKEELSEIEDFLEDQFQCNPIRAIDHVPVQITEPGKYCV